MLKYALGMIFLSFVVMLLCAGLLWYYFPKLKNKNNNYDEQTDAKKTDTSGRNGKDYNGAKIDERSLEVGQEEITAVSIDIQAQKYYQNLGNKTKQDEAAELLLKVARENSDKSEHQKLHLKNHNEMQERQKAKDNKNKRQLDKLSGRKVKKKIAKKVAKKNIELTDDDIKRIKIKSLGGKMK